MAKLQASQILVKGAQLTVTKLSVTDTHAMKMIEATKRKQSEVLKRRAVDEKSFRAVVQL